MANQIVSNREVVEASALELYFSTEKSGPLMPSSFASKAGSITYSTIRKALKAAHPALTGDVLTARVNAEMNGTNAQASAAVLQLIREGFNFTKFNGRQLKNGTRNASFAMTDRADTGAVKPAKVEDLSLEDLYALIALKEQAQAAKVIVDVEATISE